MIGPKRVWLVALMVFGLLAVAGAATGQGDARDAAIRSHVQALEALSRPDQARAFEARRLAPAYVAGTSGEARRALLSRIGAAARDAGDVTVRLEDAAVVVTFLGGEATTEVRMTLEAQAPYRIVDLTVGATSPRGVPAITLTADDLPRVIESLETQGYAGVIVVRREGVVLLERAFGVRDPARNDRNQMDTIFGIGSRPIDFTVAAILLLEQDGVLGLDDPIGKHFPDAPSDRRDITVRQIIEGRSGLPDFIHAEVDADPDLSWIARAELERRLFAAPLAFPPGSSRQSSHAAFGLLAALVERVSGRSYATFLRERIFEPAQMRRTGFYGDFLGLDTAAFAAGGGPRFVGSPNIPPHWGPTSWLVMGSGGMVSTAGDLQRFDAFIANQARDSELRAWFDRPNARSDGSDGGFDLHSGSVPATRSSFYLLLNAQPSRDQGRALARSLERLIGLK